MLKPMLSLLLNILFVSTVAGWLLLLTLFDDGAMVHLLLLVAAIIYVLKLMGKEWKRCN